MKSEKTINQTRWTIDQAHSEISFKVKHMMISHVKGSFKVFDANIYTFEKDFSTAEIDLWIAADSIETGNINRDDHLKSADFLDVKNHKQISFTSSTMGKPDHDGVLKLWGELTMVGITKNIELDVKLGGIITDPYGNEKAGFTVSGTLNRTHWELGWNTVLEAGGIMVGEEVFVSCEFELTNAGQEDPKMELETNSVQKTVV